MTSVAGGARPRRRRQVRRAAPQRPAAAGAATTTRSAQAAEIQPEQARQRGTEHAADAAGDDRHALLAARPPPREQPARPYEQRQRRERGEVVLAEERRLAPSVRHEPHDADHVGRDREEQQQVDDRLELRSRPDRSTAAPSPSAVELDHLRRRDERRRPVRGAVAEDEQRRTLRHARDGEPSSRGSPSRTIVARPRRCASAGEQDVARDDRRGRARRTRRARRLVARTDEADGESQRVSKREAAASAVGARGPSL